MNILIIGLGSIGQKHIIAIREAQPDAVIYALRSTKDAEQFQHVQNIYSLDELAVKPDFVIISNPTKLHGETILQTLQFDCPLFIEKPVLADAKNVQTIIDELRKKNTITYVACNLRFHPAIHFLKKYLHENPVTINEVNIYCGSSLPDWRPGKDFRKIYSANAALGGGVHLDLIHELDYCMWLFGDPLKTRSLKRNVSSLKIDAVDFAAYHLLYDTFSANITLNYFRKDSKREIEIITEKETIKADLLKCTVTRLDDYKIIFEQPYQVKDTYVQQVNYFIGHIKNNQQPMNSFEEAIDILKIALS